MQSHCWWQLDFLVVSWLAVSRILGGDFVGGKMPVNNSGPQGGRGGGEPFLMHVSHSHTPKFPLPLLLLTPAMQASKNTINDPVFQGCH